MPKRMPSASKAGRATVETIRVAWVGVLVLLLLLLGGAGAQASEVVDLRIGSHPEFTRVVFELDAPAGYRIERATTRSGGSELVVSLDASSIPRKVQSDKALIGLVKITPRGNRSEARIELKKDGLSLKEMILANPPRIVLDVLAPESLAKKKTAPKPAPKPVAKAPAPKPAPAPAPKAAAKPTPEPVQVAKAPAPAPKAAPTPTPKPAPKPAPVAATEPTKPEPTRVARAEPEENEPAARGDAWSGGAPAGEPSEGGVATMGVEPSKPARPQPGASATARSSAEGADQKPTPMKPTPMKPKPMKQAKVAEADSGIGMGTIVAGVAALIVVIAAFVFVRRRRAGAADVDEGQEVGGPEDNPFSGLASADGAQPALSLGGESELTAGELEFGAMEGDSEAKEEPGVSSLMSSSNLELDGERTAVSGIAQPGAGMQSGVGTGGDEEIMRIVNELERRVASLESRLDEVTDARERLERQVAAQTEELRVQRAAIARTQRAVRNMSRPEDEGPTEPAIRDPR